MRCGEGGIVSGDFFGPDHEGTELARVLASMAGPPAPLPPDAGWTPWTPEEIAEFKARIEVAVANPGPLRVLPSEHWKDRAEAAEAKLADALAVQDRLRGHLDAIAAKLPVILDALSLADGAHEGDGQYKAARNALDEVWPF